MLLSARGKLRALFCSPDARFRESEDTRWDSLTPWQLFHVEPNRSYGVSSWVNENDVPVIEGQVPLYTPQGETLTITVDVLTINDADIEPAYHVDYALTVYGGDNHTVTGVEVAPDAGFTGVIQVPVSVNDGAAESATFELRINVGTEPDTVPPEIALVGPATVTVQLGSVYTDAGATATDNIDGDITDRIIVDNPVDTATAGTYAVSYSVEDQAGNRTVATRTVIVEAATPPPPPASSGGGAFSLLLLAVLGSLVAGIGLLRNP